MPITFPIAPHPAEPFSSTHGIFLHDEKAVLGEVMTAYASRRILQSSVSTVPTTEHVQGIVTQRNGFVMGALLAYNKHHCLVIRPDDVWIAILSQINFYINAHVEELRHKFVSHPGRMELRVTSQSATVEGMDFGDLTMQISEQIHKKVRSRLGTLCGIPTITLEGTQADWQSILSRLDKLPEFGAEPTEWASMLRAILTRFIRAFSIDPSFPNSTDKPFWERMIHEENASGTFWIGGWMSAFCAWDAHGAYFADAHKDTRGTSPLVRVPTPGWARRLELDGVRFPRVTTIPEGYAEVSVRVIDVRRGKKWQCRMLAGHVGNEVVKGDDGREEVEEGGRRGDTIRMAPQWFVYVKGEPGGQNRSYLPFY
ncbi:hypothetical protein H0H87_002017 [Tephrocybe sp. NHM501043]|nr:hypothetical protein H0H87_002017 [Tephrocybe sp. NHM501043]